MPTKYSLKRKPLVCAMQSLYPTSFTSALNNKFLMTLILSSVLGLNASTSKVYAATFPAEGTTTIYNVDAEIDGNTAGRLVLDGVPVGDTGITVNNNIILKILNFNTAGNGGAIEMSGGATLNIIANGPNGQLVFSNNTSANLGGAIFNDDGVLNVTNASFLNNNAAFAGGAILNNQNGTLSLNNSYFSGNTVTDFGAGAVGNAGTATIFNSTFNDNSTSGAFGGGAIINFGGMLELSNSSFNNNSATSAGGAFTNLINNNGIPIPANATISGNRFNNNSANAGGAIFNSSSVLSITDSSFSNNSAVVSGGAIETVNGVLNLTVTAGNRMDFIGNSAAGMASSVNVSVASGETADFNINVADGALLDMQDPMGSTSNEGDLSIIKIGNGAWLLGGSNDFLSTGGLGQTSFLINNGALYLSGPDAAASAASMNIDGINSLMTFSQGATLVAGGDNRISSEGTIYFEGATIRGGNANTALGGGSGRSEAGGNSSLTLEAAQGVLLDGEVRVAAIDSTDKLTLNADFSDGINAGQLLKIGNGTVVLTGASNFTGDTNIDAGNLEVNGSVTSNVNVQSQGRLSGRGSVGSTVVDGVIAPGNSIGTLTVNGTYTQNSGSFYELEVNAAGASDLININGAATLNGGTVAVIDASGLYTPMMYTILTASGGVLGQYDNAAPSPQPRLFLDFLLSYDTNNVFLNIVQNAVFATAASTANQSATANAVASLGLGNPVFNAVLNVADIAQAQQAFNALSGEAQASVLSAFTEDSRYVRSATLNRLDEVLVAPFMPVMDKFGKNSVAVAPAASAFWAHAYGAWGKLKGNRNAAEVSRNNKGFVIGADKRFGENVAGLLGGYSRSRIDVDKRASKAVSDDYSLGIYAGRNMQQWSAKIGGVYTWHELDMKRNVAFANFFNHLKSNYSGHTAQLFAEMDYDLSLTRMLLKPFAGAAYVYSDTGSWTESGGAAALRGDNDFDIFYTSLGIKQAMDLAKSKRNVISESMTLAWRHAYNSTTPTSRFRFVAGGAPFNIQGAPIAKDSLLIDAGLNMAIAPKRLSLRLAYIGQFADAVQDNGVSGSVTWQFD